MLRHDHSTAGAASQCCVGSPRLEAARLFRQGQFAGGGHAELGVSRQTAQSVVSPLAPARPAGLESGGAAGSQTALNTRQLGRVERALLRGPQRHGFRTDLWTAARVATVIERLTGVHLSCGHVWYILRGLRGRCNARPARRASEDEPAIPAVDSRSRWPAVKKTPGAGAPGSSSKTKAGSSQQPVVRRTWRRAARPRS